MRLVLRDLPIGFVKYFKDCSYSTALTLQGVADNDLYLYGYESFLAEFN